MVKGTEQSRLGVFTAALSLAVFAFPQGAVGQTGPNICDLATDDLGGLVWRDYDSDGTQDPAEPSVDGSMGPIVVSAFDSSGLVEQTLVAPDGTYAFDGLYTGRTDQNIRLEFSGLPQWASNGMRGANSATTVQFVNAPGCTADLAVQNRAEYCQSNPTITTACFAQGNQSLPQIADEYVVVEFPYEVTNDRDGNSAGTNIAGTFTPPPPQPSPIADAGDVGTTFGLAYRRETQTLYAAAFSKRGAGFGPNGAGAIYQIDRSGPTPVASLFVDLNAVLPGQPAGVDPRPTDPTQGFQYFTLGGNLAVIVDAFPPALMTKVGFGDIEISPDGETLYAVSLNDRTVYSIPTEGPLNDTTINGFTVPTAGLPISRPGGSPSTAECPVDDVRPFGLGIDPQQQLYIGAVCSAESTGVADDLMAYVWRLDPVSGVFTLVFSDAIHWDRNTGSFTDFSPWAASTSARGPILSDIEFDGVDMIIALRDRSGDIVLTTNPDGSGTNEDSMGDILRACPGGPGWLMESGGICGSNSGDTSSIAGPGGGEFYFEDFRGDVPPADPSENVLGGLLQLPGRPDVLVSALDPVAFDSNGDVWINFNAAGLNRHRNVDGVQTGAYNVYRNNRAPNFAKAAGLGDLQAFCNLTPLEIGNLVWLDADGDGTQGPAETRLGGVTVALLNASDVEVASAVTNAAGEYYFIDETDPRLQPGGIWETVVPPFIGVVPAVDGGLVAETDYTVRIDFTQAALLGLAPTLDNVASGSTLPDAVDSDGVRNGNVSEAVFTTGAAGENDHTLDFGFVPPVSIGSYVFTDVNGDGFQDGGDTPLVGATVALLVSDGMGGFVAAVDLNDVPVMAQTTIADGLYFFDNLPPGDYVVEVTPPSGLLPTLLQTSTDDDDSVADSNIASESFPGTYRSGVFTLEAGNEPTEVGGQAGDAQDATNETSGNMTVDFGFVEPVSIGSYVFIDNNIDGLQDGADSPIVGATINLLVSDGMGGFVVATDLNRLSVLSQTTLADGLYFFDNLPPGDYVVEVTPPMGLVPTPTQTSADDDDAANDSNIAAVPTPGTYRSGLFTLRAGAEPSEPGAEAGDDQDTAAESSGNMTVDFGFAQPVSIGSYVFTDVNGDGLQDSGDAPIVGASVNLLVSDGLGGLMAATDLNGVAVMAQVTLADGLYFFDNLPASDYAVEVTPPVGVVPTPSQNPGDNDDTANDSNIASEPAPGTYRSGLFSLEPVNEPSEVGTEAGDDQDNGAESSGNMTVDFGFVAAVSIGSYVFNDNNVSGQQDAGDTPIAGATVALLVSDGIGGLATALDLNGLQVMAQVTLADGLYFFDNLPPGDYVVEVMPPAGLVPTPLQTTADDDDTANDSNIASEPAPGAYRSGLFVLRAGGEPTEAGSEAGDGQDSGDEASGNMTVDFGFVADTLGSIGDTIYLDNDGDGMQDADDQGIPGVTVTLTPPATIDLGNGPGQPITTQTDSNGQYLFPGLPAGNYIVTVDTTTGPLPDMNNTGDPDTGPDSTSMVTLPAGTDDLDQDFGYQPIGAIYDYGDLPALYGVIVNGDQAGGHYVLPAGNPSLGNPPDTELDGQPDPASTGDDEEDGVSIPPLTAGLPATITIDVNSPAGGAVFVNAWIDYNGDGDFDDPGEQVAIALDVTSGGMIPLDIVVPTNAAVGPDLGVRVRLSSEPNLLPTGLAPDGEIEDYLVQIALGTPVAIPTLSQWVLALLALLVATLGTGQLRQQHRRVTVR